MTLTINIIGAGKLGRTLGHLWVKHNLITINSICNVTLTSAEQAVLFIEQGKPCDKIKQLGSADIFLISTPDAQIQETCQLLTQEIKLKPGTIILHCSGALSSTILEAAKAKQCYVASVHPLQTFADPNLSIQQFSGTYCAMEGDKEAILILQELFSSIGGIPYQINPEKKSLYHAAGVFASNYVVTLADQALTCLEASGIETPVAMQMITKIMQTSINNLTQTSSPNKSLTGPLKRGDGETIKQHLDALKVLELHKLYSELGKATLSLTSLDAEQQKACIDLFDKH